MAVEVKICGLTRARDAELAVRLGASYLGAVLAESPRQVNAAGAREIVRASGDCPVVGVFVDAPVDDILRLRDRTGISAAQLHGEYATADRERCAREGLMVWAVSRLAGEADVEAAGRLAEEASVHVVLVEPRVEGIAGGSGVALKPALARRAREAVREARFALAGGLRPDTLEQAIALVRPDVVDVSSGVESAPGIKDADLLARFLEVARDGSARA